MNIMWFGDNPDLMKWTLVRQTLRANKATLVYIPYLAKESQAAARIKNVVDPGVWEYFKSLERLNGLLNLISPGTKVVWQGFDHTERDIYLRQVMDVVKQKGPEPVVVFFDPDTGIEKGRPGPHYALKYELNTVWKQLNPGDGLLLYQHSWMKQDWQQIARDLLDQTLEYDGTRILSMPMVTKSAVLLYALKI